MMDQNILMDILPMKGQSSYIIRKNPFLSLFLASAFLDAWEKSPSVLDDQQQKIYSP